MEERRARLITGLAALLAIMACNAGRVPAAEAPSLSAPLAPSPASPHGIPVSATPLELVIPDGLASGATAETIDVVTDQTGAPWDVAPAHLQLTFQDYALQGSFHVPQIFVYPAQQYASLNPAAAESLRRLQTILTNAGGGHDQDSLPRVPFFNAGQVIAAQQRVIPFSGGAGVRFVTQYGQDVSPISNSGLFYHFEGLSQSGSYYIIAVLPINLPFLAADSSLDAPVPAGGVPFPPASAAGPGYEEYFKLMQGRIEAAPADQFTPSLSVLDALAESIHVSQ